VTVLNYLLITKEGRQAHTLKTSHKRAERLTASRADAVLHGKRSCRPRSRAVRVLTGHGFRVRPLCPLRPVVAPLAGGQGSDTLVIADPRLNRFPSGRPPLLAMRWPEVTGLTS
jgi:hypothetical protein